METPLNGVGRGVWTLALGVVLQGDGGRGVVVGGLGGVGGEPEVVCLGGCVQVCGVVARGGGDHIRHHFSTCINANAMNSIPEVIKSVLRLTQKFHQLNSHMVDLTCRT